MTGFSGGKLMGGSRSRRMYGQRQAKGKHVFGRRPDWIRASMTHSATIGGQFPRMKRLMMMMMLWRRSGMHELYKYIRITLDIEYIGQ